ncbi:Plug domain-containing protein [Longimicrobium sp.]|uniref:Plug domain-containing protein n=1 Tax=Longimicrobium sp. TaxID=2029185 RepID=UPI002C972058|nr:Plug domain-containing protein [Longimicrobium sp.]HSU17684.1 Plug domain-containing protein [Longimicrobium sp.]
MTARPVRLGITLAALLATTAGCATLHPARDGESHSPARSTSHYLSSQEIKESGAQNAWEVLRRLGGVRLQETADGTPVGIRPTRGHQTIVLDDTPIVLLDGARLLDFALLRSVPARQIDSVEFLNGINGTLKHGTGGGGGAIVILTRVDVDHSN